MDPLHGGRGARGGYCTAVSLGRPRAPCVAAVTAAAGRPVGTSTSLRAAAGRRMRRGRVRRRRRRRWRGATASRARPNGVEDSASWEARTVAGARRRSRQGADRGGWIWMFERGRGGGPGWTRGGAALPWQAVLGTMRAPALLEVAASRGSRQQSGRVLRSLLGQVCDPGGGAAVVAPASVRQLIRLPAASAARRRHVAAAAVLDTRRRAAHPVCKLRASAELEGAPARGHAARAWQRRLVGRRPRRRSAPSSNRPATDWLPPTSDGPSRQPPVTVEGHKQWLAAEARVVEWQSRIVSSCTIGTYWLISAPLLLSIPWWRLTGPQLTVRGSSSKTLCERGGLSATRSTDVAFVANQA